MEQDNENRQTEPGQPVENDLFNLTDMGGSAQPKEGVQPAAPDQEPVSEPEFKVNQEDHPAIKIKPESERPQPAYGPFAFGQEKPQITLRSGAEATLGNLLTEARNAAGYSIETVSQENRIRHDFIEALEADHADALPNYVFLRAYVRALIAFYNLDRASAARVEGQMEKYQPVQDVPEKLVEDIGRGGQISETETRRIKMALIYGGIILVLLISLVVTSIIAVSVRNRRIQAQRMQQEDRKFDTARLETLIPPQLPQPQVLQVPSGDKKNSGKR